jgi:uncharacterized damage-inducible protein DinB
MVRLEFLLDSWKSVRQDAAQAVLDMPDGGLEFQPTPDVMTFRELAVHILNAGHALTGVLRDKVDLTAPDFRDRMRGYFVPIPPDSDARLLAGAMGRVIEEDCDALAAQAPAFFEEIVTKWDGQQLTRLEMVQFIKEHELVHRAQMFVYLRLNGVVPPTTRRRLARK